MAGGAVQLARPLIADDTPIPVLAPGTGKTKNGRLWAYLRNDRPAGSTDPPAVLFRYSPDRKGERPRAHLQHFRGILQADAYGGFNGLYDRPEWLNVAGTPAISALPGSIAKPTGRSVTGSAKTVDKFVYGCNHSLWFTRVVVVGANTAGENSSARQRSRVNSHGSVVATESRSYGRRCGCPSAPAALARIDD